MQLRALLQTVVVAALVACSGSEPSDAYSRIQQPPAELLHGFASYSSPVQVRKSIPTNLEVTTIEDSGLDPGDTRPRFDVLILSIPHFNDRGHSGELRLEFLNQRLLGVWFYPDAYESYVAFLENSGLELSSEGEWNGRLTRVWTTRDFQSRQYVAWEDTRLASEQRKWIQRYS
jgi:hypothetical protein